MMRNGPLMGPHWEDIYSGGGGEQYVSIDKMLEQPTGYHTTEIKRGELGEISKIQEEVDELTDRSRS